MRNFGSCHDHKSTFNKIPLNVFLAKAKHSNVTVRGILSLLLFFFSLCSEASTLDIHLSVHFMDIQEARLLALIEGVLAANIFDWGSRACVDLYHKGTIIEIYRMSRKKMQRPWRASIPSLNFLNVTVALRPLRVIKKRVVLSQTISLTLCTFSCRLMTLICSKRECLLIERTNHTKEHCFLLITQVLMWSLECFL